MNRRQKLCFFFLIALFGCVSVADAQVKTDAASLDFRNDDLVALNAFFKANIYRKGPYEKTADYEAKIEALLGQTIAGNLTGKSEWTYYQPLATIGAATFDPDAELYEIIFLSRGEFNTQLMEPDRALLVAGRLPRSYDALSGTDTPLTYLFFLGDYSNLPDLIRLNNGSLLQMKIRVSPDEAHELGLAGRSRSSIPLMLRITFVPKPPYRSPDPVMFSLSGDRIYGSVKRLSVVNSKTGKVYFETSTSDKTPTRPSGRTKTRSSHQKNPPFMPPDNGIVLVPVPKEDAKIPVRTPASSQYDRFIGIWSYSDDSNEKRYFRLTKDLRGRFRFDEGWNDDPGSSKITWGREVVMLKGAEGIFLNPLNGKLHGRFVSANFRATHGNEFTYVITLRFQPNGKVLYSLGGVLSERNLATRVSDQ